MEVLRHVIVLLHIIGFAVIFGALASEAAARRFQLTPVMDYGVVLSLVTGLALAAPWAHAADEAPDAMINIATCQQELGDVKGARASLETVLIKYPDSAAASTAKQRLKSK